MRHPRRRTATSPFVVATALTTGAVLALTACGRSGGSTNSSPTASGTTSAASPTPTIAAGSFGTAQKVCAPGPGTGGSGRGIVGNEIHIGTLADPGAAATPGLGQEFFDVANAFSKWCNAAGGINGRKIVVDELDAKLFNGAAVILQACQRDFMLVGGENALDAADVKPRLACKLGQIPSYTVSPDATAAGLQVSPNSASATVYPAGELRLLADAYPASKQGLAVAGSSLSSLKAPTEQAAASFASFGYKVSILQPRPISVDNYRPYLEQMKASGAKADFEILAQDATPIFNGMNDIGWKPSFVLFSQTFYSSKSVEAAKAVASFPPSYVNITSIPWELSDKYPVVAQAKSMLEAAVSKPSYTYATDVAFSSWVLWAQSATACGANLTQACVLDKAAQHPSWDAGGLSAPVSTDPTNHKPTACTLVLRLTTTGFVYDKAVTKPTDGLYNCDPQNLVTTKDFTK